MRLRQRVLASTGLVLGVVALAWPAGPAAQEPGAAVPPAGSSPGPGPAAFVGTWDYNAAESLDAVTGRPEQNPQNAVQRRAAEGGGERGGGATGAAPRSGSAGAETGRSGGRGGGGQQAGLQAMARAALVADSQRLLRDLHEIAEELTITLTPGAVTIADDLGRERTYPTDDKKRKYQLGAAEFEARARWDGRVLVKEIEGANGFRMTELYFLSLDGQQLFLLTRAGSRQGLIRPAGANRVYDRVMR